MFEADDIREWRGHNVVDDSGSKIGELEALYVDTRTDEYEFATVKVGLLSRARLVFVPTAGATVGPSYFKVRFPKKQVRDAPSDRHRRRAAGDRRAGGIPALRNAVRGGRIRTPARPAVISAQPGKDTTMALFLLIIIVAIALGILGVVIHGLFWLLIIGIVIFLANLVFGGVRLGKNRGSRVGR